MTHRTHLPAASPRSRPRAGRGLHAALAGALLAGLLVPAPGCRKAAGKPPVLLLTVDTLRRDHVSLYGQAPPGLSTPAFDRIGREGAVVLDAVAPFPRTTQSVGTFLTGLHPLRHGADGLGMRLPDRVTTLAEAFRAAGYRTAAFVTNVSLRPGLGFEQGFDLYSNPRQRWGEDSAPAVVAEALAWARDAAREADGRPVFLWVHLLDPHWSYEPPPEWARRTDPDWQGPFPLFRDVAAGRLTKGEVLFFADRHLSPREIEHARRLYRAEVLETDAAAGRLLDGLAALGWLGRGVVAFAADHGEAMGDHRYWFGHGEYLYDDTLRVPMMFRAPGRIPPGTRLAGTVRLEDLAPTLLDLAGVPAPEGLDGRSLLPALRRGGEERVPDETAVHLSDHELVHPENPRRPVPGRPGRWWALRRDGWKLIRVPLGDGRVQWELYDLRRDPGETRNLADREPDRLRSMEQELARRRRELLAAFAAVHEENGQGTTREEEDALRSLGYMN